MEKKKEAQPPFPNGLPNMSAPWCFFGSRCLEGDVGATLSIKRPDNIIRITYHTLFKLYNAWEIKRDTVALLAKPAVAWGTVPTLPLRTGDWIVETKFSTAENINGKMYMFGLAENGLEVWVPQADADAKWDRDKDHRVPQWGVRGEMEVVAYDNEEKRTELTFKLLTVWQRYGFAIGKEKAFTDRTMTVQAGTYAGYAQMMASHGPNFPSIWVRWYWDEKAKTWQAGLPRKKGIPEPYLNKKTGAVEQPGELARDIFIHPGAAPSAFLGCMAPGHKWKNDDPANGASPWLPWGFDRKTLQRGGKAVHDAKGNTIPAEPAECMWQILHAAGYDKDGTNKMQSSEKRPTWFYITVEDPNNIFNQPRVVAIATDTNHNRPNRFEDPELPDGYVPSFGEDLTYGKGGPDPTYNVGSGESVLKDKMRKLLKEFARSDRVGAVSDLFERFLEKQKAVTLYEDNVLTAAVAAHPNTDAFCQRALNAPSLSGYNAASPDRIHQTLKSFQWDIYKIPRIIDIFSPSTPSGVLNDLGPPAFNISTTPIPAFVGVQRYIIRDRDLSNGLFIAIDGIQKVYVVVTDYHYQNGQYDISLRYFCYDVFGLDRTDLETYGATSAGFWHTTEGEAFTAWWQLQHQFGYAPLVTRFIIERTFTGIPAK